MPICFLEHLIAQLGALKSPGFKKHSPMFTLPEFAELAWNKPDPFNTFRNNSKVDMWSFLIALFLVFVYFLIFLLTSVYSWYIVVTFSTSTESSNFIGKIREINDRIVLFSFLNIYSYQVQSWCTVRETSQSRKKSRRSGYPQRITTSFSSRCAGRQQIMLKSNSHLHLLQILQNCHSKGRSPYTIHLKNMMC